MRKTLTQRVTPSSSAIWRAVLPSWDGLKPQEGVEGGAVRWGGVEWVREDTREVEQEGLRKM